MEAARLYELMNKDVAILAFSVDPVTEKVDELERFGSRLPIGFTDTGSFLASRKAPSNRSHIQDILRVCRANTLVGYLDVVHCLSATDTFWVRKKGSDLNWGRVSIFSNGFDRVVERIAFEGGLFGEELSSPSPEASMDGSFAKCVCRHRGRISLMKAPARDSVSKSWAPWSEVMAYQVANALSLDCVPYELHWHRSSQNDELVPTCICPLFTSDEVGFVSASRWLHSKALSYTELLEQYDAVGAADKFRDMVVLDALTLNIDRHMGNHGLLFDTDSLEPLGMAPIFDNNMAFMQGFSQVTPDNAYIRARQFLTPAIGADFNDIASIAIRPDLRRRIRDLGDFEFDRSGLPGMPEERIEALEGVVRAQSRCLSASAQFHSFSLPPAPVEDLSWQLKGWPDDPSEEPHPPLPISAQQAAAERSAEKDEHAVAIPPRGGTSR